MTDSLLLTYVPAHQNSEPWGMNVPHAKAIGTGPASWNNAPSPPRVTNPEIAARIDASMDIVAGLSRLDRTQKTSPHQLLWAWACSPFHTIKALHALNWVRAELLHILNVLEKIQSSQTSNEKKELRLQALTVLEKTAKELTKIQKYSVIKSNIASQFARIAHLMRED
ncbi:hypothetical protein [Rugamonas aquatica]|uniref:Uncharacterized protein n=1 Tax=Rugamonas aquatica TaxID=2743357 RepID=A0A6A7N7B8_9BURK|nr:hypothetical protein [Rugamonas aquatica]MQA40752.1 hypothetical protein [Rugamonas aquatica]